MDRHEQKFFESDFSLDLRPYSLFLQQEHAFCPSSVGQMLSLFATTSASTHYIAADLLLDGELVNLDYQRSSSSLRSHVVVELPNLSTMINGRFFCQHIVMGHNKEPHHDLHLIQPFVLS
jgi:hypothetical protein